MTDAALPLILVSLVAGHVTVRSGVFQREQADVFHRYVIYVCLPAVVLELIPKLVFQPALAVLVLVPWITLGIGAALVSGAARAFGFRRDVTGALLLCVPLGNTSFLGFPMIGALLGPDAIRYAVVYDQLGSFFALATYGLIVVARYSGQSSPTVRDIVLRLVKFPPFIALLLALVPVPHPALLDAVLARIGDTLVPIALFAVGMRLELGIPKDRFPFAVGLMVKMLALPIAGYAVVRIAGATGQIASAAVLEAGMPPMITAGALAGMAGLAPELAAALVAYGVIASFVTLPILASLLRF